MPKKRMIDPALWDDPDIGGLTIAERLLFIGLVTLADDYGHVLAEPRFLCKRIFGYDQLGAAEVEEMVRHILATCRNVKAYQVDGQTYIEFVQWTRHQHLRYQAKAEWPGPSGRLPEIAASSGNPREIAESSAPSKAKLSEAKLSEARQSKEAAAAAADPDPEPEDDDLAECAVRSWYEELGASPSPRLTADLRGLAAKYPDWEWWEYALDECAAHNSRNVRYLERCLESARRKVGSEPGEEDRRRYVEGKYAALFRRARDGLGEEAELVLGAPRA